MPTQTYPPHVPGGYNNSTDKGPGPGPFQNTDNPFSDTDNSFPKAVDPSDLGSLGNRYPSAPHHPNGDSNINGRESVEDVEDFISGAVIKTDYNTHGKAVNVPLGQGAVGTSSKRNTHTSKKGNGSNSLSHSQQSTNYPDSNRNSNHPNLRQSQMNNLQQSKSHCPTTTNNSYRDSQEHVVQKVKRQSSLHNNNGNNPYNSHHRTQDPDFSSSSDEGTDEDDTSCTETSSSDEEYRKQYQNRNPGNPANRQFSGGCNGANKPGTNLNPRTVQMKHSVSAAGNNVGNTCNNYNSNGGTGAYRCGSYFGYGTNRDSVKNTNKGNNNGNTTVKKGTNLLTTSDSSIAGDGKNGKKISRNTWCSKIGNTVRAILGRYKGPQRLLVLLCMIVVSGGIIVLLTLGTYYGMREIVNKCRKSHNVGHNSSSPNSFSENLNKNLNKFPDWKLLFKKNPFGLTSENNEENEKNVENQHPVVDFMSNLVYFNRENPNLNQYGRLNKDADNVTSWTMKEPGFLLLRRLLRDPGLTDKDLLPSNYKVKNVNQNTKGKGKKGGGKGKQQQNIPPQEPEIDLDSVPEHYKLLQTVLPLKLSNVERMHIIRIMFGLTIDQWDNEFRTVLFEGLKNTGKVSESEGLMRHLNIPLYRGKDTKDGNENDGGNGNNSNNVNNGSNENGNSGSSGGKNGATNANINSLPNVDVKEEEEDDDADNNSNAVTNNVVKKENDNSSEHNDDQENSEDDGTDTANAQNVNGVTNYKSNNVELTVNINSIIAPRRLEVNREAFTSIYDKRARVPEITVEILDNEHFIAKKEADKAARADGSKGSYTPRDNFPFVADTVISSRMQATNAHFKDITNLDRGHMVAAANHKRVSSDTSGAEQSTYNFINVAPQIGNMNQGYWERFERMIREYLTGHALKEGSGKFDSIEVITGPIYFLENGYSPEINKPSADNMLSNASENYRVQPLLIQTLQSKHFARTPSSKFRRVWIPTHYFKVVIAKKKSSWENWNSNSDGDSEGNRSEWFVAAFIVPHRADIPDDTPISNFLAPIKVVEDITGIEFLKERVSVTNGNNGGSNANNGGYWYNNIYYKNNGNQGYGKGVVTTSKDANGNSDDSTTSATDLFQDKVETVVFQEMIKSNMVTTGKWGDWVNNFKLYPGFGQSGEKNPFAYPKKKEDDTKSKKKGKKNKQNSSDDDSNEDDDSKDDEDDNSDIAGSDAVVSTENNPDSSIIFPSGNGGLNTITDYSSAIIMVKPPPVHPNHTGATAPTLTNNQYFNSIKTQREYFEKSRKCFVMVNEIVKEGSTGTTTAVTTPGSVGSSVKNFFTGRWNSGNDVTNSGNSDNSDSTDKTPVAKQVRLSHLCHYVECKLPAVKNWDKIRAQGKDDDDKDTTATKTTGTTGSAANRSQSAPPSTTTGKTTGVTGKNVNSNTNTNTAGNKSTVASPKVVQPPTTSTQNTLTGASTGKSIFGNSNTQTGTSGSLFGTQNAQTQGSSSLFGGSGQRSNSTPPPAKSVGKGNSNSRTTPAAVVVDTTVPVKRGRGRPPKNSK